MRKALLVMALLVAFPVYAQDVERVAVKDIQNGQLINADPINAEFDNLVKVINLQQQQIDTLQVLVMKLWAKAGQ